jgi:hypothetical protein
MSNDSDSVNQLDLTGFKGIMLGAWVVRRARKGEPPERTVVPGSAAESRLYQRLVENRMPAGIDPEESADHPNTLLDRFTSHLDRHHEAALLAPGAMAACKSSIASGWVDLCQCDCSENRPKK